MFKKSLIVLLFVFAFSSISSAATWNVDVAHSSVGFSVRHMVVSKTKGNFDEFTGSVEFDGKDLAAGSVDFNVQTATVDTDDEKRDEHLRSADFFEAATYPVMTFKSKKITATGTNFKLVGDLTIKDVTKEVTFDCEFSGVLDDPWGNTRAGFSATTKIDRKEFNITFGNVMDNGGLVVGDEVTIEVELELIKAK